MKKYLSLVLAVLFMLNSVSVVAATEESDTSYFSENFNNYITGGTPDGVLNVASVGNGAVSVVEEPDALNKSVYLKGGNSSRAALYKAVTIDGETPVSIAFRFKISASAKLNTPIITAKNGNTFTLMEIKDAHITSNGASVADITPDIWNYISFNINLAGGFYSIFINGRDSEVMFPIDITNITNISFEAGSLGEAAHIDDISVSKTDLGSDREYYPSEIFLTPGYQANADAIAVRSFNMFMNSTVAYKNGQRLTMSAPPLEIDHTIYLPLRFTAENLGAEVIWNKDDNSSTIFFGGKEIRIIPDSDTIYLNGAENKLTDKIRVINGTTYINPQDAADIFSAEIHTENGFVMIGSVWDKYTSAEKAVKDELVRMVKYQRPSAEQILNDLLSYNQGNTHPRLFGRQEDFNKVKSLYNTDEFIKSAVDKIRADAESMLSTTPKEYKEPVNNSSVPRYQQDGVAKDRVMKLSFMYMLEGNETYAQRAKEEALNIAQWPDWNSWAYLDTADLAETVSIAYDWLYDYLTEGEKSTLRKGLIDNCLKISLSVYRGNPEPSFARTFWISSPYNWNPHCNLGTLMGCFAIAEDVTEQELNEIIVPDMGYAIRSLEPNLDEWMPDGGWNEGPGYGKATIQLDAQVMNVLETALGTDYSLTKVPGLAESANFIYHMTAPAGLFNWGDSYNNLSNQTYLYSFYLSKKLGINYIAIERKKAIQASYYTTVEPFELLWYDEAYCTGNIENDVKDRYFRNAETAAMRSSWSEDAMYVGLHSGVNGVSHTHFDTGSFILDYNGVRWADDLGADQTVGSNYSGKKGDSYRERAEGNNTICIDNTPYYDSNGGWIDVYSYDFEDQTVGDEPQPFTIAEKGLGEFVPMARIAEMERNGISKNKVLKIATLIAESGNEAYAQLTFQNAPVQKGMEISFKFNMSEIPTNCGFLSFYDSDNNTCRLLNCYLKNDVGRLRVYKDTNKTQEICNINKDTWYDVKFVIDVANKTYDMYLDGELKCDDYNLYKSSEDKEIKDISKLRLAASGVKMTMGIDDFNLKVHPDDADSALKSIRQYDQTIKCTSLITRFESKPKGTLAVTDMTNAYASWADSAIRGVMLTENRNTFVVKDEINLKGVSDVYWFSHFQRYKSDGSDKMTAEVSEDGKSVILTDLDTNSRMWVGLISDADAEFYITDCTPLPNSPNPEKQTAKLQIWNKIALKLEGVETAEITVVYKPLNVGETEPASLPANTPIESWSIPDGELPKITSITLNGEPLIGFSPDTLIYNVALEEGNAIPTVAATVEDAEVRIKQAESLPGKCIITVTQDGNEYEAIINFSVRNVVKSYIQGYAITEDDILTSSIQEEENPPSATIDGNYQTRWSAEGTDEWIIYDFRKLCQFSELDLAWYNGARRQYKFKIEFSEDGINWIKVFDGASSGTTGECETYSFDSVNARYLRITANGSNENLWNNIAEVR